MIPRFTLYTEYYALR